MKGIFPVRASLLALSVLAISGCATTPTDEIFRSDTPSMKDIYFGHGGRSTKREPRHVSYALGDQGGYTRNAGNEINHRFPTVNNPRLVMYVFPHIGKDRLPVPGYATAFPLFEKAALYALPGEIRGDRRGDRQ